jgi:predicted HD phosphohydrolase
LNIALKETDDIDLILAAMLHDIGKAVNTLEHDKIAIEMLKDYASVKTLFLIENHLRIRLLLNGDMKRLSKVQFLINHPWLPELILLARK